MAVSVIDTRGEFKLGHCGFSSLRLGASWSVVDDN